MTNLNIIRLIWLASIILISILFYLTIPILRRVKMGQWIRSDGPQRHLTKAGTPTMGGIIIIIGALIAFGAFLYHEQQLVITPKLTILLISLVGFGIIGYLDDYLIVVKKNNKGLSPRLKFILQLVLALIIYFNLLSFHQPTINIFGYHLKLGYLYGFFILFFYASVTNAVNITDGIDGLAGGLTIIAFGSFAVLAFDKNDITVFYFCLAVIASIIAFFLFNFHPAKIFMGDTGSMALGGALASVAILLKMEVLLIVIGGVFVWETLSDIIQVWYFKKTKGKRVFLMAPFHHHLELKGWSEWQIDLLFWSTGIVLGLFGIFLGVRLF